MEDSEGEERVALSVGPQPSTFAWRPGGRHDRAVRTEAPAGALPLALNRADSPEADSPKGVAWRNGSWSSDLAHAFFVVLN